MCDPENKEINPTACAENVSESENKRSLSSPKMFWEELKPWSYYSKQSFLKLLARPLVFALSPAVWFTFFACKFVTGMFGLGFTFHRFMKLV